MSLGTPNPEFEPQQAVNTGQQAAGDPKSDHIVQDLSNSYHGHLLQPAPHKVSQSRGFLSCNPFVDALFMAPSNQIQTLADPVRTGGICGAWGHAPPSRLTCVSSLSQSTISWVASQSMSWGSL